MELTNTYYKKIIYKKNAFDDLKTYFKLNYADRGVCLISTKSIPSEDVTRVLNSLFCASENVSHFVSRCGFDERELLKLDNKLSNGDFDVLVSFGGGRCCDVVKYFADKYDLPYVVCPSSASSLAFFSALCINPFNAVESFVAKMPNKIFIQESIIKNSNFLSNINGLCFLNSLRMVWFEGLINDNENERYIMLGLEKLFGKLENECMNILLCDEDANLVLMDLMIDFGFFINMLPVDNYLFSTYRVFSSGDFKSDYVGKKMLLIAKTILCTMKRFLELNSFDVLEVPNYEKISKLIKKYNIFNKKLKNNTYFCEFMRKPYIKKELINNKQTIYNNICLQLLKINNFCRIVKSVYKVGIEMEEDFEKLTNSVAISPFIYGNNVLMDFVAGSGILNSFIS